MKAGTDFHIRDKNAQDVEDDVDIDGDDRQVFGDPQFTEHDILQSSHEPPNENTDDTRHARQSLRDLIEGKSVTRPRLSEVKMKMEAEHADLTSAIISARKLGDSAALINALEAQITHLVRLAATPLHAQLSLVHRNRRGAYPRRHRSAASAWTLTTSRRHQPDAGTRAAASVGCGA